MATEEETDAKVQAAAEETASIMLEGVREKLGRDISEEGKAIIEVVAFGLVEAATAIPRGIIGAVWSTGVKDPTGGD